MTNKETARLLRNAASAVEHGRYATFRRKLAQVADPRGSILHNLQAALQAALRELAQQSGRTGVGCEVAESRRIFSLVTDLEFALAKALDRKSQ